MDTQPQSSPQSHPPDLLADDPSALPEDGGGDDEDMDLDEEPGMLDEEGAASPTAITGADMTRTATMARPRTAKPALRRIKGKKLSKHGLEYPSLPPAVVKRLAQTFARTSGVKTKIGSDTLAAISQASDWFFEQLGDDLQAYSQHAGRKTIDESDMVTLMQRYVPIFSGGVSQFLV